MFGKFDPIPNAKTDTNNNGPFSTDNIGMNYRYPEASYEERKEIIREHEEYQKGYFYFLCNDPRVPEDARKKMSSWGWHWTNSKTMVTGLTKSMSERPVEWSVAS